MYVLFILFYFLYIIMYVVYSNLLYFLSIFLFTYNKNLLSPKILEKLYFIFLNVRNKYYIFK